MAKPIIKPITPFDAFESKQISFIWNGFMVYNSRLVVYDAETNLSVFDDTYSESNPEKYQLYHTLPANTLTNGKRYAAQIYVIDRNGNSSEPSDKYYFNVLTTPDFAFDDLIATETPEYNENIIESQSYVARLIYNQVEREPIASYQFFLYSSDKELLDSSQVFEDPNKLTYTYRTLESNISYFFRATGETQKGITLDTGYIKVTVTYQDPSLYARLYAEPNPVTGIVDYYSNIVDIESDEPSSDYVYDNGCIDLTHADETKTLRISNSKNAQMSVQWLDLNGVINTASVGRDEGDINIASGYTKLEKIEVDGYAILDEEPSFNPYQKGTILSIDTLTLTVNNKSYYQLNDYNKMYSLSNGMYDSLTLDSLGRRVLDKYIAGYTITGNDEPYSTGYIRNNYGRNMFTCYYDLGAKKNVGNVGILCDALPVGTDTTHVALNDDGLISISWDTTEINVTDLISAKNWLAFHNTMVIYPLEESLTLTLDSVIVDDFENLESVSYSNNFNVPIETDPNKEGYGYSNATFSVKLRDCFKNCAEILKAQKKDMDLNTICEFTNLYLTEIEGEAYTNVTFEWSNTPSKVAYTTTMLIKGTVLGGVVDTNYQFIATMSDWTTKNCGDVPPPKIDTFLLSSEIGDDEKLRFKLVVYNGLSDIIMYSEPLSFKSWDIVSIHIRRKNGLYGLYVFVTDGDPDPTRNIWFVDNEPISPENSDLWFSNNVNRSISYIPKEEAMRYYQDEKPTDAPTQSIWIGGDE